MKCLERETALKLGEKRYQSKRKCKYHGICFRWVSNYKCIKCATERRYNWRKRNPTLVMIASARYRARKLNLDFDLTIDDIKIPQNCPVLGIPLQSGIKKYADNSPTLDRKNNTKGYTKDNVTVISYKANRIKNDSTLDDLKKICKYVETFSKT